MTMRLLILALLLGSLPSFAHAQEAIRNRSVRIIEPGAADAPETPAPAPTAPPNVPADIDPASNPAGVRFELLPGTDLSLGAKMAVRVSVQKPGYLVLVDVDSAGKLTQIFPNTQSLASPQGTAANANLIAPNKPRLIPDPQDKASFNFVAAPPPGVGMVVAILSDKPVQMIDLPDVPKALAGRTAAVEYVRESTTSLKILPATDTERVQDPKWSFATKFYVIK